MVVHFGVVVAALLSPRRWRRRRKAREKARAKWPTSEADATGRFEPTSASASVQEHRWLAVMFTDIVDSTALNEALGDSVWSRLLAVHRDRVRACMRVHGGAEVGTQGDGFLVRFDTPHAAVETAAAIQKELAEAVDTAAEPRLQVRIGIHAGEALDDGGDLVGRVVNVAARVTAAARAGEIRVTEPVADHLTGLVALDDRGLVSLKGVAQARHLLAVRWTDGGGPARSG